MNGTKRYEALTGIRALACIGIVMMHVLINGRYNLHGYVFDRIIPSFTNFVFLFMTISGFGMCCGYYDKFMNKEVDITDFYKKRYRRILPFFAFLCFIDILISPSIESLYEVIANLTLCFGLIPNANITVIGVGWFLGIVFVFYLMFPFFCFLLSDKKRAWISLFVSYVMNILCKIYFDADRKSIAYSFTFFMLGGIIFLYKDQLSSRRSVRILSVIVLISSGVSYYVFGEYTCIMMAFNAAVVVAAISGTTKMLGCRAAKFIGGLSMEIYLCHMVVYRVVEKVHLLRLFPNDFFNYFVVFCMVLGGAVLFSFLGKRVIGMISEKIG